MEVDSVRIACPACGSRLTVMPRIKYLVCKHCGSEYLVQRQGNTIGLEPFEQEQFQLSKSIAEVERSQGEGCSNVSFWIFAVIGVFFCLFGFLGRALLDNVTPLIVGWALSLLALGVAAVMLLQTLGVQREQRQKLEARQQELYEQRGEDESDEAVGENKT